MPIACDTSITVIKRALSTYKNNNNKVTTTTTKNTLWNSPLNTTLLNMINLMIDNVYYSYYMLA